ncbi:12126_t:CDS:1, partial [Racocetra persica]
LVVNSNNISSDLQILKFSVLSLEKSEGSKKYKSYSSYLNPIVAQNFAIAIVHIIEKELINEIRSAKNWSIMIDESNSIDKKYLVIVAQYIALNVLVIHYMGVIKLDDYRLEYIFEKIKEFYS